VAPLTRLTKYDQRKFIVAALIYWHRLLFKRIVMPLSHLPFEIGMELQMGFRI
jgi:hypothetical protein